MKKVFAFMMALALMLSLSVTASAADDGKITVTNATIGQNYSVYKIFDATYSGDKVAYSIKTGNPFFTALFGTDGKTANDYFIYTATDTDGGSVVRKDGKTDAQLFNYLTELVKDKVPTKGPVEAETTQVVFDNLAYGYYVITSTLGGTVTINSAKPEVEVKDKNATTINLDKKVNDADENTAQVGDTVKFSVEFTALNYDGENKIEKYTLEDTLNPTDWAEIDSSSIEVFVNNTKITNWTRKSDADKKDGFEIEIPWVENGTGDLLYAPSSVVKVTYSAKVVEGATEETGAAVNKNTATLEWSDKSGSDETTTKVYNMGFTKIDGETNAPLAGAKFGLYSNEECTVPVNVTDKGNGVYVIDPTSTTNEVVTLTDGEIVIMGLAEGDYWLKEIEAPAGYNKLATAQPVTVGDTDTDTIKIGAEDYTVNNAETEIKNNKGVELPSTGGEGTMKMITIGAIVALAFAILLITNKKMTAYQD